MASQATIRVPRRRFYPASPYATRGHWPYERLTRWRVGGRERASCQRENEPSSSIDGMPQHIAGRLLLAAGIVLPARRPPDLPPPISRRRLPRARPLPRPLLWGHIAGAATLVPWPTRASIRSQARPTPFSDSPRCRRPRRRARLAPGIAIQESGR